jgi:hypothetical protein
MSWIDTDLNKHRPLTFPEPAHINGYPDFNRVLPVCSNPIL